MGSTLEQALNQLVGQQVAGAPAPVSGPPPTTSPSVTPAVADLIGQALQHNNAAQAALKQGDLGAHGREIGEVGRLLLQDDAIQKGVPAPSPSASPGPSPAASPRASSTGG